MATLVRKTDSNKPSIMTILHNDTDVFYVSININIEKVDDMYTWDALELPQFALEAIHTADADTKYAVLIAHIIKGYYNDNEMTAILSNYLSDMTNEKYKAEFEAVQRIRKIAKETSKYIITNKLF
jgi:hypothetical protein